MGRVGTETSSDVAGRPIEGSIIARCPPAITLDRLLGHHSQDFRLVQGGTVDRLYGGRGGLARPVGLGSDYHRLGNEW